MNNISIIVACGEQQSQLRQLLPTLLNQRYGGEYEVIVVDKMHDKDLEEWLEEMEVHNSLLSHTFCSTTGRGIDIHRLALTLGAKAANHEWLVLLPVETDVPDEDWLSRLTTSIDDGADLVVKLKMKGETMRMMLFRLRLRFAKYLRLQALFRCKSPSIILCRRNILLQAVPRIRMSKCKILKSQIK